MELLFKAFYGLILPNISYGIILWCHWVITSLEQTSESGISSVDYLWIETTRQRLNPCIRAFRKLRFPCFYVLDTFTSLDYHAIDAWFLYCLIQTKPLVFEWLFLKPLLSFINILFPGCYMEAQENSTPNSIEATS